MTWEQLPHLASHWKVKWWVTLSAVSPRGLCCPCCQTPPAAGIYNSQHIVMAANWLNKQQELEGFFSFWQKFGELYTTTWETGSARNGNHEPPRTATETTAVNKAQRYPVYKEFLKVASTSSFQCMINGGEREHIAFTCGRRFLASGRKTACRQTQRRQVVTELCFSPWSWSLQKATSWPTDRQTAFSGTLGSSGSATRELREPGSKRIVPVALRNGTKYSSFFCNLLQNPVFIIWHVWPWNWRIDSDRVIRHTRTFRKDQCKTVCLVKVRFCPVEWVWAKRFGGVCKGVVRLSLSCFPLSSCFLLHFSQHHTCPVLTLHQKLELLVEELGLLGGDLGAASAVSDGVDEAHARQRHLVVAASSAEAVPAPPTVVLKKSYCWGNRFETRGVWKKCGAKVTG